MSIWGLIKRSYYILFLFGLAGGAWGSFGGFCADKTADGWVAGWFVSMLIGGSLFGINVQRILHWTVVESK